MILSVVGGIAAGETTVCRLLEERGFKKISLSDILRNKVREAGLPVVRKNLRSLGDKMRREEGKDILARLAWKEVGKGNWVIDSLLAWEEAKFLRGKDVYLIGVVAPDKLRYERSLKRDNEFDSFEAFMEADKLDRNIGTDKMLSEADFLLNNDGTFEDLGARLDAIIKTISSYYSQK